MGSLSWRSLRADFTRSVIASLTLAQGGIAQPGDVYGRGNRLVPLAGAVRTGLPVRTGRRGKPKVQVFQRPTRSISTCTWAHWLIGDAGARWLGVPLLNLLEAPLQGLSLKVLENDHFRATSTPFEGVVGGAVTQVPFLLQPKAAWTDTEEEITATLRSSHRASSSATRWS